MTPLRAFAIALLVSAASAAAAPAPLPKLAGRTLLAGCRQGECRWLQVASVESAGRFPQGELRRMRARTGTSTHLDGNLPKTSAGVRIAWEGRPAASYAFCSTRRPAFAFTDETGGLVVHFLDLFDLAGYQYSSAGLYMRLCHARAELPPPRVLRALGYRAGTKSAQVETRDAGVMTRF